MPTMAIGAMRERLTLQKSDPEVFTLASLTRSGTVATATTLKAHGYATGDYVTIAGAVQAYNGKVKITVTSTTAFTFTCTAGLTTPATGLITVVYVSDAQGGRRTGWITVDAVAAELMALGTSERLQLTAIHSDTKYRFRIRTRPGDVTEKMRALWTPSWPPNAPQHTLEINGLLPADDGRTYTYLECAESPR